VKAITYWFTKS